jgi:hypothetical protein
VGHAAAATGIAVLKGSAPQDVAVKDPITRAGAFLDGATRERDVAIVAGFSVGSLGQHQEKRENQESQKKKSGGKRPSPHKTPFSLKA